MEISLSFFYTIFDNTDDLFLANLAFEFLLKGFQATFLFIKIVYFLDILRMN